MSGPSPDTNTPFVVNAKTRAQVLRDKVVIRLATNTAGPEIAAVLKENKVELPGADWDSVFPHWLIATVDDDVIGCCQVSIAKPVGFVEFMFVRKSAPFKLRAIALRKLGIQALSTLHLAGCAYIGGVVATSHFKFANVIKKMHFSKLYTADVYVRRIA